MNNAGIGDRKPVPESNPETTDEADWDRVMDVNLKGTFLGMKYALPVMKEAGGGSIINVSSMATMIGSAGPFAYTGVEGRHTLDDEARRLPLRPLKHPSELDSSGWSEDGDD